MYLRFNGEKAQPEAETELDIYRQQSLFSYVSDDDDDEDVFRGSLSWARYYFATSKDSWETFTFMLSCCRIVVLLLLLSVCCEAEAKRTI